mgnify:FL=1
MLNHITLMGRLTHNPELRRTSSGIACCNFSLACERDIASTQTGQRETDFIDCVAWRNTAEFVSKYFSKGSMAAVSGRLQVRTWQDKNGNSRRTAEILCDNIYFGSTKTTQTTPAAPEIQVLGADYPELTDTDEGLPF